MADKKSRELTDFIEGKEGVISTKDVGVIEAGVVDDTEEYSDGANWRVRKTPDGIHVTSYEGHSGMFIPRKANRNALSTKVDVDVSEALTGLKALQREAKKAAQALRELEATLPTIRHQVDYKNPVVVSPLTVCESVPDKQKTADIADFITTLKPFETAESTVPDHIMKYRESNHEFTKTDGTRPNAWFNDENTKG